MSRTRSRGGEEVIHEWAHTGHTSYDDKITHDNGDFRYVPYVEFITDELPNYGRFGNCLHFCRREEPFTGQQTVVHSFGQYSSDYWGTRRGNSECRLMRAYAHDMSECTLEHFRHLGGQAVTEMRPSLNSELSLTNFLIELTSFKSLFKIWERGDSFLKNVSSRHLQYEFGWRPFVGDCQRIVDGVLNWRSKLNELIRRAGKVQCRHWKKDLSPYFQHEPINIGDQSDFSWVKKPTYVANMRYIYELPDMTADQMEMAAILDTFGLFFDEAVVWEMIPYSFVVDWFAGVGPYLQRRRENHLAVDMHILDFCASISYEYRHHMHGEPHVADRTTGSHREIGLVTEKRYERLRHIPDGIGDITKANRFGIRQTLLSASLINQRR